MHYNAPWIQINAHVTPLHDNSEKILLRCLKSQQWILQLEPDGFVHQPK
jgi:hypothetical protein